MGWARLSDLVCLPLNFLAAAASKPGQLTPAPPRLDASGLTAARPGIPLLADRTQGKLA
jgi:hypothetical protein